MVPFRPRAVIESVAFGGQWIELHLVEEGDRSEDGRVVVMKSVLVDPTLFPEDVRDLQELALELADKAAIHRRQPPERVPVPEPKGHP